VVHSLLVEVMKYYHVTWGHYVSLALFEVKSIAENCMLDYILHIIYHDACVTNDIVLSTKKSNHPKIG
jgi:hypothetical protein